MIDKNKILKKADDYANANWNVIDNPNEHDNAREDFAEGAFFAGKKLSDIAVEFADWIDHFGYEKTGDKWSYWDNGSKWYTTKELFEEFLKRR